MSHLLLHQMLQALLELHFLHLICGVMQQTWVDHEVAYLALDHGGEYYAYYPQILSAVEGSNRASLHRQACSNRTEYEGLPEGMGWRHSTCRDSQSTREEGS